MRLTGISWKPEGSWRNKKTVTGFGEIPEPDVCMKHFKLE